MSIARLEALSRQPKSSRGVAKYEQLRALIAGAIEIGEWEAGHQLPPELEIAVLTQLSLGTVQRALRELVSDGYLLRRQGSGTFVADRRKRMEEPLHCRYVELGTDEVLPVYTRLLARRRSSERGTWTTVLGEGPEGVIVLDRAVEIDSRFIVASRIFLPARRFRRLLDMPLRKLDGVNVKKLLIQEFGIKVHKVEQRLRIEEPSKEVRKWLQRENLDKVLTTRATGFEANGQSVYYQLLWAPAAEEELLIISYVD